MQVGSRARKGGGNRNLGATGSLVLAAVVALGIVACSHDWSPAADGGDAPADRADVPFEDGPAPVDGGETAEDARTEPDGVADSAEDDVAAQDADAEDVALEDVPPP